MRVQLLPSKGSPSGEGYWDINKPLLNDAINPLMGVYFRVMGTGTSKNPTVQGECQDGFFEQYISLK